MGRLQGPWGPVPLSKNFAGHEVLSLFLFMCVTFNLDELYNMLLLGDGNVCELEVAIDAVACEEISNLLPCFPS